MPVISRWIDRLVRHHPVQFRCAPDGVLLTLGTPWGLFRHYWILVKFLLTIGAITVLLVHTIFETVSPTFASPSNYGEKPGVSLLSLTAALPADILNREILDRHGEDRTPATR